ncbi:MAG: hypothetical protein K6A64_07600 [Bacteroidales bacterium]|nr:hypothetical protein [Bacteroidales bacterium]
MRIIISLLAGFVFAVQALAQATVVYSYDSAGNRTQRDTTSTNVAMLPTESWNVMPIVSNDLLFAATFGEVVISDGGTSPKQGHRRTLMEKFEAIKSQPLHKPSSGAHNKEEYE